MSFSRWLPPLEHGWDADVIVAQDAAYRRSDLLALDDLETLVRDESSSSARCSPGEGGGS